MYMVRNKSDYVYAVRAKLGRCNRMGLKYFSQTQGPTERH